MIKIQPHHVNRGKFQLDKKGSTVLKVILPNHYCFNSNTSKPEVSEVFNWQFKNNSSRNLRNVTLITRCRGAALL